MILISSVVRHNQRIQEIMRIKVQTIRKELLFPRESIKRIKVGRLESHHQHNQIILQINSSDSDSTDQYPCQEEYDVSPSHN